MPSTPELPDPQRDEHREKIPQYLCHKRVRALQIAKVHNLSGVGTVRAQLHFVEPFAPVTVEGVFLGRYYPLDGDYYVVYDDGYVSLSPKKVFEEGYTRVELGSAAPLLPSALLAQAARRKDKDLPENPSG